MANGKIIISPDQIETDGPMIFLAGPIQGSRDWQDEAVEIIQKLNPEINIASPRRKSFNENFVYEDQVNWETKYLRRSAKNGIIMFWLAKEAEHNPERAYAQTTRFELAEWKVRHEHDGTKVVVGIEDGFTGAKYIKFRFPQDCPDIPILSSLKDTCKRAVELALIQ